MFGLPCLLLITKLMFLRFPKREFGGGLLFQCR